MPATPSMPAPLGAHLKAWRSLRLRLLLLLRGLNLKALLPKTLAAAVGVLAIIVFDPFHMASSFETTSNRALLAAAAPLYATTTLGGEKSAEDTRRRIILVNFTDDETKSWPPPLPVYAKLLGRIAQAGPAAIFLDIHLNNHRQECAGPGAHSCALPPGTCATLHAAPGGNPFARLYEAVCKARSLPVQAANGPDDAHQTVSVYAPTPTAAELRDHDLLADPVWQKALSGIAPTTWHSEEDSYALVSRRGPDDNACKPQIIIANEPRCLSPAMLMMNPKQPADVHYDIPLVVWWGASYWNNPKLGSESDAVTIDDSSCAPQSAGALDRRKLTPAQSALAVLAAGLAPRSGRAAGSSSLPPSAGKDADDADPDEDADAWMESYRCTYHAELSAGMVIAMTDAAILDHKPFPSIFRNAYVFVGARNKFVHDEIKTYSNGLMPGSEIHAMALDNMLRFQNRPYPHRMGICLDKIFEFLIELIMLRPFIFLSTYPLRCAQSGSYLRPTFRQRIVLRRFAIPYNIFVAIILPAGLCYILLKFLRVANAIGAPLLLEGILFAALIGTILHYGGILREAVDHLPGVARRAAAARLWPGRRKRRSWLGQAYTFCVVYVPLLLLLLFGMVATGLVALWLFFHCSLHFLVSRGAAPTLFVAFFLLAGNRPAGGTGGSRCEHGAAGGDGASLGP